MDCLNDPSPLNCEVTLSETEDSPNRSAVAAKAETAAGSIEVTTAAGTALAPLLSFGVNGEPVTKSPDSCTLPWICSSPSPHLRLTEFCISMSPTGPADVSVLLI